MTPRVIDLAGQRFGKLSVQSLVPKRSKGGKTKWICECDCGNIIEAFSTNLRRGYTIGCGKCRSNIANQHGRYDLKTYDSSFNEFLRTVKGNAKRRGFVFELTEQGVRDISKQNCFYCGRSPYKSKRVRNNFGSGYVYNGIDRVDNSKGYMTNNCVPCCETCNRMKLKLDVDEFKQHIILMYNHWASH